MGRSSWQAPRWVRAFWCVWCLLFALIALGVSVAAVVGVAKGEAVGDAIFLLVVLAPLGYIAVKAALRIGQTGVTIGGDGVVVVGPLRTRRVSLSEADSFRAEVLGSKQPTVGLHCADGRVIAIWALNRNGFMWSFKRLIRELEPVAAEFNERLAEAKGGPRRGVGAAEPRGVA
jgi:hypothetical protein